MNLSLIEPLAAVRYIARLAAHCEELGMRLKTSSDFKEFDRLRKETRDDRVSPMFDAEVSRLDAQRAFWMAGFSPNGRATAMQAFRIDHVDTNLAEWAMGWMISLYLQRDELVVPARMEPPQGSRTRSLSGRLVYHGEMWIDRHHKTRDAFDTFLRIGILLAYIKWQPDALWALISNAVARHGYIARSGYGHQERGFFEWTWEPKGADRVEWVVLAERAHIEYLIAAAELIRS